MGVAADPMFALVARAMRNGFGCKFFWLQIFKMNPVKITQHVSLVKKALETALSKQTLHSKSIPPLLFHDSKCPKYLNKSAFWRYTLTSMVPKRRPRIDRSIDPYASDGDNTPNITVRTDANNAPAVLPMGRSLKEGNTARTQNTRNAKLPKITTLSDARAIQYVVADLNK